MHKQAYSSFGSYDPNLQGKTLEDLFMAIRADAGLPTQQKAQVIGQLKGMVGYAGPGVTLSSLMSRGLGGMIGFWISKYFGMGAVGRAVVSLAGAGIGGKIHEQLNKPKNPNPGWNMWG